MSTQETSKLLNIISNPIRANIIKTLKTNPQSFSNLMKNLSIESTSKLSFHLDKLSILITKNEQGYYELSHLGEKIYSFLEAIENDEVILSSDSLSKIPSQSQGFLKARAGFFFKWLGIIIVVLTSLASVTLIINLLEIDPNEVSGLLYLMVIIGLVFPGITLFSFVYFYHKKMDSFTFQPIVFGLSLIFYFVFAYFIVCTMMTTIDLVDLNIVNHADPLSRYFVTILFNENKGIFPSEMDLFNYRITTSAVFLFWSVIYAVVLFLMKYFSSSSMRKSQLSFEPRNPFIPKWIRLFDRVDFWIVIILLYLISYAILNRVSYDISHYWFDTPSNILASQGSLIPSIDQILPILPSLLLLIVIYLLYYRNPVHSSERGKFLSILIIFEPILLGFVTVVDSLIIIGSNEINEPSMLGNLMLFMLSKMITGFFHLIALIGFSLLLLKLVLDNQISSYSTQSL